MKLIHSEKLDAEICHVLSEQDIYLEDICDWTTPYWSDKTYCHESVADGIELGALAAFHDPKANVFYGTDGGMYDYNDDTAVFYVFGKDEEDALRRFHKLVKYARPKH